MVVLVLARPCSSTHILTDDLRPSIQSTMILCNVSRYHPLPALDLGFLHVDWPVMPVQLVVQTASIADGMASFVPAPERRDGSAAILTRNDYVRSTAGGLVRVKVI